MFRTTLLGGLTGAAAFCAAAPFTCSAEGAVGGHAQNLRFEGNQLIKKAPRAEAENYRTIWAQNIAGDPHTAAQKSQLQLLQPFVPKLFSTEDLAEGEVLSVPGVNNKYASGLKEAVSWLAIENMTHGMSSCTVADLKLGTSTLTLRGASTNNQAKIAARAAKDSKTTSAELGFMIVGYNTADGIKTSKTECREIQKIDVIDHLRCIFSSKGKLNQGALEAIQNELEAFEVHFAGGNRFEFRGASLFIVLDHEKKDFRVKLIDLSSIEDKSSVDQGVLKGIREVRKRIDVLLAE